jgi:cation:H+ antiporter
MDWVLLGIPVGIILLYFGSDWLVKGGKGLALRLGIPAFVIGLTILAFGSSAPECITSIVSTNNPGIIIGNVIGSNIANIGLAIGAAGLIAPMAAKYSTMKFELAVMLLTAIVLFLLAFVGHAGLVVGIVFVVSLVLFVVAVYKMKKDDKEGQEAYTSEVEEEEKPMGYPILILLVVLGLVMLYFGARFFVDGAVELAHIMGMSELLIGLIVVAVGTSLPEICISVIAARRGENDMAVANIVGSNIFNILFVLGIGACLVDVPIPESTIYFHMPVMLLLTVAMICATRFKNCISRPMAGFFVAVYVAYVAIMIAVPSLTL